MSLGKSLSLAEPLFLMAYGKDTGGIVSLLLQEHVEALHQKTLHEWKEPLAFSSQAADFLGLSQLSLSLSSAICEMAPPSDTHP